MSWNHRVTKRIYHHKHLPEPETLYEIREVFYDENGDISGITETPHLVSDSVKGLKWTLRKMLDCCKKPIIDYNTGEED